MISSSRLKLLLVNLISIIGLILAIQLSQHFYSVRSGVASYESFCNINSTVNCDVVAASSYSEFAFGIPLSNMVAGWYVALLLLGLIAHAPRWRKESVRFAFGLSLVGTVTGLFYLVLMSTRVKAYCLLCIGIDLCNIFSFLLLLSLRPEKLSFNSIDRSQWKVLIPLILISIGIPVYGLTGFDKINMSNADIEKLAFTVINSPKIEIESKEGYPAIGPKSAPITIVEFSDFQCPFCRLGASLINTLYHRYAGKIRIEFRNFPIDPSCNSYVNHAGHPTACEAAKTVLCANKVGKFEEMYQLLFENQGSLVPGKPKTLAKNLGLDERKLETCMKSPEITKILTDDIQEGLNLGIGSTPTFFINGHKMQSVHPIASWNRIIEYYLKNGPSK
jgi:protein-disulfide isomerase/uncharacterized membrane protein